MAEAAGMTIGALHGMVMREIGSPAVQEAEPGLYGALAGFVGGLGRERHDGAADLVRQELAGLASGLAGQLLRLRLAKGAGGRGRENLLDEERYILDSQEEREERAAAVMSAVLAGRPAQLASVSERHRTRSVLVRFAKDTEAFAGADGGKYGPYRAEDVATIPYENLVGLETDGSAARIRTED